MNKIQRLVFTIACLLTTLEGYSYKIVKMTAVNGTISAIYNSNAIITFNEGGSVTDIPDNNNVTLNITPDAGFYLQKIEYELMIDIGNAQGRTRNSIDFATKQTIQINPSYAANHYGGVYSFAMPASDIEITATFAECTDITGANIYWDSWNGTDPLPQSKVYDGIAHVMEIKKEATYLTKNRHYGTTINTLTDAGSITPTITGWGEYKGTISTTTLYITQAPLTITAHAQSIEFGSNIVTGISQVTPSGLVNGDALSTIILTPSTSDVTNSGTIQPSGATTTKGISNYNVTYTPGNLTIYQKDLSAVDLTITLDHDYFNSNNTVQKALVTKVQYGETVLASGTSYTCDYAKLGVYTGDIGTGTEGDPQNPVDYITADIYTIIITLQGNYTGSKRVKYQIRPELTVNNTDFKWRTFYEAKYNMKVPETGFTAHTVQDMNVNSVELMQRNYIKAGTPMLLFRTGDKTNFKFYPELVEPTDGGLNGWTGIKDYFKCSEGRYLTTETAVQNETLKIWVLKDDVFVRTKTGTIAAGKCYLELTSDANPSLGRRLTLNSNTTAIEQPISIVTDSGNATWYTLDGRRLEGMPTQKGIYITNGKKIIIK